ncbi:MAG: 4-phosphopantetheinyl transferase family protein [Planctomycetes bacterium]|nr:4-phosphopantetheinyl transferase family protein [Planctomycetota bacterium]
MTVFERRQLAQLADRRRREDWLCGRLLAKRVVADWLAESFVFSADGQRPDIAAGPRPATPGHELHRVAELEIRSQDGHGRGVRPTVWLRTELQPWPLSITHGKRSVAVALSKNPGLRVGVDLVDLPAGSGRAPLCRPAQLRFWMTEAERRWLDRRPEPWGPLLLWALKEAAYKAAHADNEPFRPHAWEVVPGEPARAKDAELSKGLSAQFWCSCLRGGSRCQLTAVVEDNEILAFAVATQSVTAHGAKDTDPISDGGHVAVTQAASWREVRVRR